MTTEEQYRVILGRCKEIFIKKMQDYGSSWRIMRTSSITDQIFIKAQRIRTLEEVKKAKIDEGIEGEYMAMVNYGIMGLVQLQEGSSADELDLKTAEKLYDQFAEEAFDLMLKKNHDYGEAWRDMRTSSITDLILTKILRIKQIESNDGKTTISEGIDSHYLDIINYSIFALIRITL